MSDWQTQGVEILPADPEGWWCMVRCSTTPDDWVIGDTPQEALAKFLEKYGCAPTT